MEWKELSIITHTESVEALSEWLVELGSKGVSIEDPSDFFQLAQEQREWLQVEQSALFKSNDVIVKAYFTPQQWETIDVQELKKRMSTLKEHGLAIGKNQWVIQTVGEEDWADAWKKYYYPVRVTRYLTVVPSWLEYEASHDEEKLIYMDPGLAFGTGTHPTTQLSMLALEQVIRGGERILDVGTGSGVLSIASKLLGAKSVIAYDIDEVATRVSKENLALNPIASDVLVKENDLLKGVDEPADIIVANILAEILMYLPEDAWRNLEFGGKIILSGIISHKKQEVLQSFLSVGFTLDMEMQKKEWHCLVLTKEKEE